MRVKDTPKMRQCSLCGHEWPEDHGLLCPADHDVIQIGYRAAFYVRRKLDIRIHPDEDWQDDLVDQTLELFQPLLESEEPHPADLLEDEWMMTFHDSFYLGILKAIKILKKTELK